MAGFDTMPWLNGDNFTFSNGAFPLADFYCLSSPSFSLPHSLDMDPRQKVLTNNPTNSFPSSAFSSISPSSTWATLQVPPVVSRSLSRSSSDMTVESQVFDPNSVSGIQLGMNSSEQSPFDVLMMDQRGEYTFQTSKFDMFEDFNIEPSKFVRNNSTGIEGEKKESDDDVSKFILQWLEKNKDVISPEDLRSIRLKKSTIECAERCLGPGPHGRMQLVQLILAWVQNHHLKSKRRRLQDESNEYSTNSGVATRHSLKTESQPTQYCSVPISSFYYQDLNMTSMPSAAQRAQERRMARKRRMASLKQSRAMGQNGTEVLCGSVEQGNNDAGNGAFCSFMSMGSQSGKGLMNPSLLSGSSRTNSVTMRRQFHDLKFYDKSLKFLLQKKLKPSDVGSLGRIVLPKKEAEIHLPELDAKDGITILMEDIRTSQVWEMRYKFWPNNNSRMYVLENAGDFLCSNGLEEGDFIVIYSDLKFGKYMIKGVKAKKLQSN